jgi:error-prone DNA polymerase
VLNNHTYYSLRYGALTPSELLDSLSENGYPTAVLTDINCTAAVIEFLRLAVKKNIPAVIGLDVRNGVDQIAILLAVNNEGYYHINTWVSEHLHNEIPFPLRIPNMEGTRVIYPSQTYHRWSDTDSSQPLRANEYVGVSPREVLQVQLHPERYPMDRLVALHTQTFRHKKDFNAHRLLRAIDNNCLLSKLPKTEEGSWDNRWMDYDSLCTHYAPLDGVIARSREVIQGCSVHFDFGGEHHENQLYYTGSIDTDRMLIRELCQKGLAYRYPNADQAILDRLEKELRIIEEKRFTAYFLINWDITSYARSRNYYYVGRGSGANSVVAYLLRITDVDPIELDLYFERFINLFRQNPPDFDIDFSWREREDITNYIFSKFKNVSLLGAFVTFQYSAVVRELGKVFGLPKSEIDLLSDRKLQEADQTELHRLVLKYAAYIHDFPNYIGIHAAGILITEKPTHQFGITFMPPKGFPTVQFDMHQAEDIGINKLDILSQRGLGKIKDTLAIIQYNQPEAPTIDIHDVRRFKLDDRCNEILRLADAIGCFYVESPAMRMLLTKLQTHNYLGLVAASSVIRPGVSSSGMMRQFILRERDPERRKDAPLPLLELMPETHGVMVYQEDVIKVAHYFAGLSLGEADVLRRGMSGKFRGREEFDKARQQFLTGALQNGHSVELVKEIWRQVESFAGYAFAKGHSASYAVESYQCLFLKAYYPIEYMTATVNNYGGFYRPEIYLNEARKSGATVEGPCINRSGVESVLYDKTIFLGMQMVKGLEHQVQQSILEQRKNGPYRTLSDFLDRIHIGLEQCVLLARSGAFRVFGRSKKDIMWELHMALSKQKTTDGSPILFSSPPPDLTLPPLLHHWLEDAYDELELIGFPLCNPFELLASPPPSTLTAKDLKQYIGKQVQLVGYLVTLKPTRTSNGQAMYFGTFLDGRGDFIDTVHFPPVAQRHPVSGWGLFLLEGRVMSEFDALSLEISATSKLPLLSDPRLDDKENHPALHRKNSGTDKWMSRYFKTDETDPSH